MNKYCKVVMPCVVPHRPIYCTKILSHTVVSHVAEMTDPQTLQSVAALFCCYLGEMLVGKVLQYICRFCRRFLTLIGERW